MKWNGACPPNSAAADVGGEYWNDGIMDDRIDGSMSYWIIGSFGDSKLKVPACC